MSELERFPLAPKRVASILHHNRLSTPESSFILNYHTALAYLEYEWASSPSPIHLSTLSDLYTLASLPHPKSVFTHLRPTLQDLIRYTADQSIHPVIDACSAFIVTYSTQLTTASTHTFSYPLLVTYLYLYRAGFDLHGLLNLESLWTHQPEQLNQALQYLTSAHSTTLFLHFFTTTVLEAIQRISNDIDRLQSHPTPPNPTTHLNHRQKQILHLLENPSSSLTNRDVQQLFHISQVTASRDLSHLTTLGLIFPHGRSRSVRYTLS